MCKGHHLNVPILSLVTYAPTGEVTNTNKLRHFLFQILTMQDPPLVLMYSMLYWKNDNKYIPNVITPSIWWGIKHRQLLWSPSSS